MEIKRKLVGTQAEMIEYLADAYDAMIVADVEVRGKRDDTRIKRAERAGYLDGLRFAIHAVTDWEPTKGKSTNDGQEEQQEVAATGAVSDQEPLAGVPRQGTGPTGTRATPLRHPSGSHTASA